MQHKACDICGSSAETLLAAVEGAQGSQRLVVCGRCGLMRVNPMPTEEELSHFYKTEYAKLYKKEDGARDMQRYLARKKKIAAGLFELVKMRGPLQGKRVLEIGPGYGLFLEMVSQEGAICVGVEPSEARSEELRAKGYDVFRQDIQPFLDSYAGAPFDIIVLSHVIEHFASPLTVVKSLERFLAPDGVICAEVPNIIRSKYLNSIESNIHTAHLYYFSALTFQGLFTTSGMSVVRCRTVRDEAGVQVMAGLANGGATPSFPFEEPSQVVRHFRKWRLQGFVNETVLKTRRKMSRIFAAQS